MPSKNVKVRATLDAAGAIDFEIDGVKAKHAQMKLDKGSGKHELDFMLQDQTGKGLRFDERDPIWVGEDCPCPPPQGINSDQMTVVDCNGGRLSTVNANSGRERELRYQLNFVADDGSKADCDPIIRNGGGTTTINNDI
jgi:hypothetical protein